MLVEESCHSCCRFYSWRVLSYAWCDGAAALVVIKFILSWLNYVAVYPIYPVNVFVEAVIAQLEAYLGNKYHSYRQSRAERQCLYYCFLNLHFSNVIS